MRTYLQAIAPIAEASDNTIVSTGFAVIRPRPDILDPGYCTYALREPEFLAEVEKRSVGVNYPAINVSNLGSIPIHLPKLDTQRIITDYLDRATARLDRLVAEKRRILRLLAEKQHALITCAVTHGLDPDAPPRDSGVPWACEIPAHWETWKISHFAAVGNGSTPNRNNGTYWTGGSIPWLNSSVVNRYEVTEADQFVTPVALRECHLPLVKAGSVLVGITGQGETRGQATVLTFDATINQRMAFVTPRDGWRTPDLSGGPSPLPTTIFVA